MSSRPCARTVPHVSARETGLPQRILDSPVVVAGHPGKMPLDDPTHLVLLLHQALRRIHSHEAKLVDEPIVLSPDQSLEEPERFLRVGTETKIHSRLVVLQAEPAPRKALKGLRQRDV